MKKINFLSLSTTLGLLFLSLPGVAMESFDDVTHTSKSLNWSSPESQADLNHYVGRRSVELYQNLNNCSRYPNEGEVPGIPGDVWAMGYDTKTSGILMYKVNKNIKPSVALNQIFFNTKNPNILDCVTARTIIIAKCICEALGNSVFDKLYEEYELGLSHNINNNRLFLNCFSDLFCTKLGENIKEFSQSGGFVTFMNFPNYKKLNSSGTYSNDNLITVFDEGKQSVKYIGFGEEYSNGPLSYDEVKMYMLKAYNIGANKSYIAYKILDINTLLKKLGFKEKTSPYNEVTNCILKDDSRRKTFVVQDNPLKENIWNCIQTAPISYLSLNRVCIAKKASNLSDFVAKSEQY